MAKTVSSIAELEAYMNKKIKVAMETEVSKTVKDVMQKNVQTEVYDEYTSNSDHADKYIRRGEYGGLKDRNNMISTLSSSVGGVELTVENITKGKDEDFKIAGLIEYGNDNGYGKYNYNPARYSEGDFREARPFIETSRRDLENGLARKSLADGLRKQGLDIT